MRRDGLAGTLAQGEPAPGELVAEGALGAVRLRARAADRAASAAAGAA